MMKRNNKSGIILSVLVAAIPAAIWIVAHPSTSNFTSLQSDIDGLAKLLGIVGASLYAWNLILSARIGWLEKQFGGLDKLYKIHHIIGGLAFIAILIHPALLIVKYASLSLVSAYIFIVPTLSDLALQAGKLALLGMIVVLFITFYIYVSHERFIWIHRLTGVLYVVAMYHFLFTGQSDVRQIPLLFAYMSLISVAAVLLYSYRSLFGQSLKPRYRYQIKQVNDLGGAWEIVLAPTSRAMEHEPGQFSFVSFISDKVDDQPHPFSISSAPGGDNLRYTIKNLGDYTSTLSGLKVGDKAFIEGPYGSFSYANMDAPKQLWVAGGIGVTPFLSMARSLVASSDKYDIDFYYSVADMSQAYFADELVKLAAASGGRFRAHIHDSSKAGFLTADVIGKDFAIGGDSVVLLCGPGAMMHALESQFESKGVAKKNIHYEEFSLL